MRPEIEASPPTSGPSPVQNRDIRQPSAKIPTTVLLLGNYRPTLVLAAELKRGGSTVIAGLDGCGRGAELSRFVDEVWSHPSAKTHPEAFLSALRSLLADRPDIGCVFPVAEEFVRLFAKRKPRLPAHVTLAMVAPDTVTLCLDKRAMMELAVRTGVPIAPFAEISDHASLLQEAERIGFPLVVRPADSTQRLNGEKALTLNDRDALMATIPAWPADQAALLIQKKASGIRHNFYFAAKDGRICRRVHAVITRTDRRDGSGLAVDGITVTPDPDLQRHTADLLEALNYSGIGCAQYLVDAATGAISFLEINARIAGNHAVPEACDLELGRFLMDCRGTDAADPAMRDGRGGLRYSWIAGDIEGLVSSWRRGEISVVQAFGWMRELVRTAFAADLDMMLNWRDPLPGLVTLLDVVPGVGRLTRQRHRWPNLTWKTRADLRPASPFPFIRALQR